MLVTIPAYTSIPRADSAFSSLLSEFQAGSIGCLGGIAASTGTSPILRALSPLAALSAS
jgi:hypothetical protein